MSNNFPINLESLIDLSTRLNQSNDELSILNATLLSLMGKLTTLRGAVFIPCNNNSFELFIHKGKKQIEEFRTNFTFKKVVYVLDHNKLKSLSDATYFIAIPLIYADKLLALICIGKKINNNNLSEEEHKYINLVSTISANALQNAKANIQLVFEKKSVDERNLLLTAIQEISRDFSSLTNLEQIKNHLSYVFMGQLLVSKFSFHIMNETGRFDTLINRFKKAFPQDLISNLANVKNITFVKDLILDNKYKLELISLEIEVICPLIHKNELKAIFFVSKKLSGEFSNLSFQFLESLGSIAVLAIENERLIKQELEKKVMENELNLALEIQNRLLPFEIPIISNYDVFGLTLPSKFVGGDYYDFIKLENNRYFFAIADVSGKGIPASLLMANFQAALKTLVPLDLPLKELVWRLNSLIYNNTSADKFITFFCGILDYNTHTFEYINAGHNRPFFIKNNNSIDELKIGGMILGVLDNSVEYKSDKIYFEKDSILLMYTDGIVESKNIVGEDFEDEKLKSILRDKKNENTKSISYSIIREIEDFTKDTPRFDDITILCIKRLI
jgi:sigma-B regulation protein RsbU (phosphoserine phosphatase)